MEKEICLPLLHFGSGEWRREEWEYGAGIAVTAITTVLADSKQEQSSLKML